MDKEEAMKILAAATAADIKRLIDRCRTAVRDRFGVELREEIVYLGAFDQRPGET